ncbi:cysteine hydrolase family protein [Novosphingobium profundi]|uniref:cysteine hydrolase family protein n=1 Tax=Novosphingobium profundi TaxID=1774954 RepID=UPI001FE8DAE0|nr:isochorismatase family protein [Novosphingobium profundi]
MAVRPRRPCRRARRRGATARSRLARPLGRQAGDVLVGTLTNVCVESTAREATAREANMRGYKVIVVADACSAVTDAEQDAALLNLRLNFADVKRTAEVLDMARTSFRGAAVRPRP